MLIGSLIAIAETGITITGIGEVIIASSIGVGIGAGLFSRLRKR